ncbi:hypothetical protein EIP86_009869 [Pleurotus ostreatoroseus]|nr:hypothetical protein EIP86_009869 [Pleurotus ostreatoroseus]
MAAPVTSTGTLQDEAMELVPPDRAINAAQEAEEVPRPVSQPRRSAEDREANGGKESDKRGGGDANNQEEEGDEDYLEGGKDGEVVEEEEEEVELTGPAKRRRPKEELEVKKGQKPGNPGRFDGEELAYLEEGMAGYLALPQEKGTVRNAALKDFWVLITAGFWARFPWKDVRANLAKSRGDAVLKWSNGQVVENTKQAIISWYRTHSKDHTSGSSNPWKSLLSALRAPAAERAPKLLPGWQVWMSDHTEELRIAYKERYPEGHAPNISQRNTVARELFQREAKSIQEQYAHKAQQRLETETARYNADMNGDPSDDPEVQEIARQRLSSVVTPLLQLIGAYTGFKVITLIGGMRVESGECMVGAVNWGKTDEVVPRLFSTFDQEGFNKNIIEHFTKFLYAMSGSDHDGSVAINSIVNASEPDAVENAEVIPTAAQRQDGTARTTKAASGKGTMSASEATQSTGPRIVARAQKKSSPVEEQLRSDANASLARKVAAMSTRQRKKEIRSLNTMTDFDFERENNIAYLKELTDNIQKPWESSADKAASNAPDASPSPSLELNQPSADSLDSTHPSPEPVAPSTPLAFPEGPNASAPSSTDGSRPAPASGITQHVSSSPQPELPVASPTTFSLQGPKSPTPRSSPPGTRPASPNTQNIDQTGWPKWMVEHFTRLSAEDVGDSYGGEWSSLLEEWVTLERSLDFKQPRVGLPVAARPADISWWIKNARSGRVVVKDASKFQSEWDSWWSSINPAWRRREDDALVREGTGEWEFALRDILGTEAWAERLRDVRWALCEARAAKNKCNDKRPRSQADEDQQQEELAPARKRKRT